MEMSAMQRVYMGIRKTIETAILVASLHSRILILGMDKKGYTKFWGNPKILNPI